MANGVCVRGLRGASRRRGAGDDLPSCCASVTPRGDMRDVDVQWRVARLRMRRWRVRTSVALVRTAAERLRVCASWLRTARRCRAQGWLSFVWCASVSCAGVAVFCMVRIVVVRMSAVCL